MHFITEEVLLWVMDIINVLMLDLFQLQMLNDGLWIIVMFLSALILTAPIHFHCWDTFLHTPRVNTVACLWFSRKAISTLAFSSDGRYLVTGEVSIGLRCVVVFVCLVNAGRCVWCSERSSGGGACVGRERGVAGLWAAGAQVRRVLRGLFPQRQIHRERGIAARHERQPVGLEGMWGVCAYIPSVPFDIIEYLHHHGLRRVTHVPCRSRRRTLWLRWIKCPVRWRPCPSPKTGIISSRRGTDTCASGIWSRLALIRYGDDGKPASSFSTNSLQHTDSYFVLADHLKCLIIHPWSSSDTSAEKSMFIVWYEKWFWCISLILPFVTTVRGVNICITVLYIFSLRIVEYKIAI